MGDSGLTGRKIIVNTYGGMGRHGGGAFSGKDPSKVNHSAAYMARYLAKHIVAAKLARRCEVQLAYAIGIAGPSCRSWSNSFGTGVVSDEKLARARGSQVFDCRPGCHHARPRLPPAHLPPDGGLRPLRPDRGERSSPGSGPTARTQLREAAGLGTKAEAPA